MQELPSGLKIATVWLLVATGVFLGVQWMLHQRERPNIEIGNGTVVLQRGYDGHYHWPGTVNGTPVDFLVDTGATGTALPGSLARDLSLERGRTVQTRTAAGIAEGAIARVDISLDGGPTVTGMPVVVIDAMDGPPLLGMDVLGRLHIEQRNGQLTLRAP